MLVHFVPGRVVQNVLVHFVVRRELSDGSLLAGASVREGRLLIRAFFVVGGRAEQGTARRESLGQEAEGRREIENSRDPCLAGKNWIQPWIE